MEPSESFEVRMEPSESFNEARNRLVPLLEADVVATLGERYRHVMRDATKHPVYASDPTEYEERIVDNVQEEILESWIDATWPACPRHGRHPLVYHEGGWWCQQDRVVLCKLGELATIIHPSEQG